jgi:hypothetical protein
MDAENLRSAGVLLHPLEAVEVVTDRDHVTHALPTGCFGPEHMEKISVDGVGYYEYEWSVDFFVD